MDEGKSGKIVFVNKPYAVVEIVGSYLFTSKLGEHLLKKYRGYPEENITSVDLAADAKDFETEYFEEILGKRGEIEVEERDIEGCKNITIKEIIYDEFN